MEPTNGIPELISAFSRKTGSQSNSLLSGHFGEQLTTGHVNLILKLESGNPITIRNLRKKKH